MCDEFDALPGEEEIFAQDVYEDAYAGWVCWDCGGKFLSPSYPDVCPDCGSQLEFHDIDGASGASYSAKGGH